MYSTVNLIWAFGQGMTGMTLDQLRYKSYPNKTVVPSDYC